MTNDRPESFGHLPPAGFALVDEVVGVALALARGQRIPVVLLETDPSARNRFTVFGPGTERADEARTAARQRQEAGQGSAVAYDLGGAGEGGRVAVVAIDLWLAGMTAPLRYLQRYRHVNDVPVKTDRLMVDGACSWPAQDRPHSAADFERALFRITRLRRGGFGAVGPTAPIWGDFIELAAGFSTQDGTAVRSFPGEGRWVTFDGAAGAQNRYFKLPMADVEFCRGPLAQLCAAPLAVAPVWDTSDVWEHLTLDIQWNDRRCRVDLSLMASGFEGPDAERLQHALEAIDTLLKAGLGQAGREGDEP